MSYSTQDAQKLFDEAWDEEQTVSFPEHTHSSIRIAVLECRQLEEDGYSEETVGYATAFTIEHGSCVRYEDLRPAKIRATLRPKKTEQIVVRGNRLFHVQLIA
jgi:hypothetical protein